MQFHMQNEHLVTRMAVHGSLAWPDCYILNGIIAFSIPPHSYYPRLLSINPGCQTQVIPFHTTAQTAGPA